MQRATARGITPPRASDHHAGRQQDALPRPAQACLPVAPAGEITARFLATMRALAGIAGEHAAAQEASASAKAAVDAMWGHLYEVYQRLHAMEEAWNELTTRVAEP